VRWRVFTIFATISFALAAACTTGLVRSYVIANTVHYGDRDPSNGVWQREREFWLNCGHLDYTFTSETVPWWASGRLDGRRCEWKWSSLNAWGPVSIADRKWAFVRRSETTTPIESPNAYFVPPTTMPTNDPRATQRLEDLHGDHTTVIHTGRLPLLPLVPILGVLPCIWLRRFITRQHQIARGLAGLCPQCGYNIVKTTRQCPECGFTFRSAQT
jgi:hypothetical protein